MVSAGELRYKRCGGVDYAKIPPDQLFTGKDLTFPIKQDNSNVRHCLAHFRRRTKVMSKCPSRCVRDAWWTCHCACCTTCKPPQLSPHMPSSSLLSSVRTLLLDWSPSHDLTATLPAIVAALKKDPEGWYKANKIA